MSTLILYVCFSLLIQLFCFIIVVFIIIIIIIIIFF